MGDDARFREMKKLDEEYEQLCKQGDALLRMLEQLEDEETMIRNALQLSKPPTTNATNIKSSKRKTQKKLEQEEESAKRLEALLQESDDDDDDSSSTV